MSFSAVLKRTNGLRSIRREESCIIWGYSAAMHLDDVKSHIGEYSWESDASYYNGKFNESLSPVILHDNISLITPALP